MSDIYAIFGTLLALGIVFPGMLTAWWLIFPGKVERSAERLEFTPWKTLGIGIAVAAPLALFFGVLIALPAEVTKVFGAIGIVAMLAVASVGASGLASIMGARLTHRSPTSEAAGFVRGAVALALAAAFPLIGWFLVIPLVTLFGFGASVYAILGWRPGEHLSSTQQAEPAIP